MGREQTVRTTRPGAWTHLPPERVCPFRFVHSGFHVAGQVVRLRYFAGLSIEQTASALGISASSIKRVWVFSRGWLKEAIESERV